MKESLYDIASVLADAKETFRKNHFSGVAARVNGDFDGTNKTYWFLVGNYAKPTIGNDELTALGTFVSRNSTIATRILNEDLGVSIDYEKRNHLKRMQKHHLIMGNRADLENKTIALLGDKQLYFYKDINEFLSALQKSADEIADNERRQREQERQIEELKKSENTARQRGVLTKGLNKLQEKYRILTMQQEEMSNLTKFIRQQGKFRYNPILDPVQNRIKTGNLFDGNTVVIDGGPGTGKTTTMIQRLKYLTDKDAIKEDSEEEAGFYKLTASQRNSLMNAIDNQQDWIFFSPSKLLKEYLADAMNREGLTNTNAKVWHWSDFCKTVIRDNYHLIDPTNENAPFKASRSTDTLIYQHSGVIDNFNDFFVGQFRLIKSRFPKIDKNATRYRWTSIALNIQERFDGTDKYNLGQFISLFANLERTYASECRELLSENRELVKRISDELSILLREDEKKKDAIEKLILPTATEQMEETDEEVDVIEEDLTDKVTKSIRQWFKRYCYSLQNKEVRLTARQEKVGELLLPLLTDEHKAKISRVGELALFEQYARYTRGVCSAVFGGFAAKYKRFRRQMLNTKNAGWNQDLLESLIQRREGKELHAQEQSLLIGYINNIVKLILKNGGTTANHNFVVAYRGLSRPIIGIDEATDFCDCDIYAMESLLSTDYSSLTICGDMMQRLTDYGITDWKDLDELVQNPKLVKMCTSYRQSSNLVNVARQLYADTIGEEPNYKANIKSAKAPKPLAYVSANEADKVDWLEKRIKEVYIAYGKRLPSIAIFLNNKDAIPAFVEALKDTDFICDTNIDVVDGSAGNVLASSNQIRVYPIDVVKGMEFDVVFFHNIDSIHDNSDLIKRYIYVGVSRAAFFLGITLTKGNDEICKYFEQNKQWDKF